MKRAVWSGAGVGGGGTAPRESPPPADRPFEVRGTSPDRPGATRDWKAWASLAALLLVALALRLRRIGAESLWMDETFTLRDTHWPPNGPNVYRPVYYVLLWLWMRISESDAWARTLAALLGVANVWATYLLGSKVAGRAVGFVAGTLCALSPLEIDHSQEIRMYTAASFFGVMGSLAALWLGSGARWWRWVTWGLCRALAILTSPFDALLLVGDALLLKRNVRTRRFGALLAGALTVASLIVLANSETVAAPVGWTRRIPPLTPVSLLRPLVSFAAWWPNFNIVVWPTIPGPLGPVLYALFAAVLVVLLGLACLHPGLARVRPLVGWAVAPPGILAAASIAMVPLSLWLERYLMFAAPYVLVLVGAALVWVWRENRVMAAVAAMVYLTTVGPALAFYYRAYHRTDWRGAAAVVRAEAHSGDSIVVSHAPALEPLLHYLRPGRSVVSLNFITESSPDAKALRDALAPLCGGGRRAYLVYWYFGSAEWDAAVQRVLSTDFELDGCRAFEGLELCVIAGPRALPGHER